VEDASDLFSSARLHWISISDCDMVSWGLETKPIKVKKFELLNIENSGLPDLLFVNGFTAKYLWLNNNAITDISPLLKAKKVENLSLSGNPIADFTPLAKVKGLKLLQVNRADVLPELKKVTVAEGEESRWSH